jgi:hypothetical protein
VLSAELNLDLYLHIGTEKTGTTSVQKFMELNRDLLSRHGVIYPRAPGTANHLALAGMAQSRHDGELQSKLNINSEEDLLAFRMNLAEQLAAELSADKYAKAVMSNEHCSSRLKTDEEVSFLRDFLSRFFDQIYVIVYLRRQDEFLLSTYSTQIKCGRTKRLRLPGESVIRDRYDYWHLLSRWARVFGKDRLICRRYERSSLVNGSIIDDFLTATRLDLNLEYERPGSLNESLDADCLEFLRLMNKHVGESFRARKLVRSLEEISNGPLLSLPEEMLSSFMNQLRDSNRQVAESYFGSARKGADPLFAPRSDDRPRITQQGLDGDRLVEITATLLQSWGGADPSERPRHRRGNRQRAA